MVKLNRNLKLKLDGNELDLSFSELKEVPVKELALLPKATHLDLSCNKIVTLPPSFCSLIHLVKLDLSKNQIKELPSNFGLLENLNTLDLYSNEIEVLPPSFSQLKKLKWLDLKNNPLKPQLKEVAGDCLDPVQCQLCAKNVVKFMVEVCIQLEKERQQRLQEEKEKEEARKLAEEKEKEKQRLAKKAAKKKRNAELKAKQGQSEEESQTSPIDLPEEPVINHLPELPVKKQSECKQTIFNFVVWTFTIFGLVLIVSLAVLWHYTQWDLSNERLRMAQIQMQQDTDYLMRKCSDFTDIVIDVVKRSTERTVTFTYDCYDQALQWLEDQPSQPAAAAVNEESDSSGPEIPQM